MKKFNYNILTKTNGGGGRNSEEKETQEKELRGT